MSKRESTFSSKPIQSREIAIVISLHVTEHNQWCLSRLKNFANEQWKAFGEIRVVDYGSDKEFSRIISSECEQLDFIYQREELVYGRFSLGDARNKGAQRSKLAYVLFFDIDLIIGEDFAKRLIAVAQAVDLSKHRYRIVALPVLYLTEEASELVTRDETATDQYLSKLTLDSLYNRNKNDVVFRAPSSSVQLVCRYQYLAMGGQISHRFCHGGEDFDYVLRTLIKYQEYPLPHNIFEVGRKWNESGYATARSLISLTAVPSLHAGLWVFHLYHPPIPGWNPVTPDPNRWNWLSENIQLYLDGVNPYGSLPDLSANERIYLYYDHDLIQENDVREILPYLGNVVVSGSTANLQADQLLANIRKDSIDKVILSEDFVSENRNLVEAIRSFAEVAVIGKGLLPGSIYFDDDTLETTTSLALSRWNKPYSEEKINLALDYVKHEYNKTQFDENCEKKTLVVPPESAYVIEKNLDKYLDFLRRINDFSCFLNQFDWEVTVYLDESVADVAGSLKFCEFEHASKYSMQDIVDANGVLCFSCNDGFEAFLNNKPAIYEKKPHFVFPEVGVGEVFSHDFEHLLSFLNRYPDNNGKFLEFLTYLLTEHYCMGVAPAKNCRNMGTEYYRVSVFGERICKDVFLDPLEGSEPAFQNFRNVPRNPVQKGVTSNRIDRARRFDKEKFVQLLPGKLHMSFLEGFGFVKYRNGCFDHVWCHNLQSKLFFSGLGKKLSVVFRCRFSLLTVFSSIKFIQNGVVIKRERVGFFNRKEIRIENIEMNKEIVVLYSGFGFLSKKSRKCAYLWKLLDVEVIKSANTD